MLYTDPEFSGDPPQEVHRDHVKRQPEEDDGNMKDHEQVEEEKVVQEMQVPGWTDRHRKGLLDPGRWQDRAEAIKVCEMRSCSCTCRITIVMQY